MGRLSDIVLRGLQFEAQQEAQELENEGRRLQMDKIIREKVAVGQRAKPMFAQAWDTITDARTPTSEIGKLMIHIPPEDMPDLLDARRANLQAHTLAESSMARMMREHELQMQEIQQRETLRREGELQGDTRDLARQREGDVAAKERVQLQEAGDTARVRQTKDPLLVARYNEANRQAGNLDKIQDQISLLGTTFPYATLADKAYEKTLKQRLGVKKMADYRKAVVESSTNAANLIRVGVDPEDAYAAAAGSIVVDPETGLVTRTEIPIPEGETGGGGIEQQIEAAVQREVALGGEDSKELRDALRMRIQARGGQ